MDLGLLESLQTMKTAVRVESDLRSPEASC